MLSAGVAAFAASPVLNGSSGPASSENQQAASWILHGTVVDSENVPVIGAGVINLNTKTGSTTDINGRFEIAVKTGDRLEVSCIGYTAKEIAVTSMDNVVVVLETDREMLEDTKKKGLFTYEKVSGIKLHCDASIAFYIYEQQKKFHSKIERQEDDSLIVTLNPSVEHEVIRWILAEAGRIQVLEPASLREKIREAGKNICARNS